MKPGWYPEPLGPWPDGPLGRKVKVLVTESCLTLATPPGSSVHGILQARILEWAAIPFSRGNLPNPGIEPGSPALQVDSLPSELPGKPVGSIPVGELRSYKLHRASLVPQVVKNQKTWVQFLGQEDPLEKQMETHSRILAWKIP